MSPQHQLRVAHFIAEVFGGTKNHSPEEGSHFKMMQKHLSKHLTEQHRKRWVQFMTGEINLPESRIHELTSILIKIRYFQFIG